MKFSKIRDVRSPERGTSGSAGIDFFVPNDFKETVLIGHSDILIPSGIMANVPTGFMLCADNKSGVATSYGAAARAGRVPKKDAFPSSVIVGARVVDFDYQGEIHIHLINTGTSEVVIKPGMKIAQFVLIPVFFDELEEVPTDQLFSHETERGNLGFGYGTR